MIETTNTVNAQQAAWMQDLHKQALPDDVFPNLPRSYYAKIVQLIAAPENGFIVRAGDAGFLWVVYHEDDLVRRIGACRLELVRTLAAFAVTKPHLLLQLYCSAHGRTTYQKPIEPCPDLYIMIVDEAHRSTGLGKAMVHCAIARLKAEGHKAVRLKTALPRVRKFYLRDHFDEVGIHHRGRRTFTVMHRAI
jgi:GNAT superfamily N-acetyltransferase